MTLKWISRLCLTLILADIVLFGSALQANAAAKTSKLSPAPSTSAPKAHPFGSAPNGCPTDMWLQTNSTTVNWAGKTATLVTQLYGWYTVKLNDTQGQEFAFCNQVYCSAWIEGAFLPGTLSTTCNYGSGENDKWSGGSNNQYGGDYIEGGNVPAFSGQQNWANAYYLPAGYCPSGSSCGFRVSTSSFYHVPGFM